MSDRRLSDCLNFFHSEDLRRLDLDGIERLRPHAVAYAGVENAQAAGRGVAHHAQRAKL